MTRIVCPHCSSEQEVDAPSGGAIVRPTCPACGRTFALRPSGSSSPTRKLAGAAPAAASPPAPPAAPGPAPSTLGPYAIQGVVGVGGMGVVYRAWDQRLDRPVAVKTLRPELAPQAEFRERFLREARSVAALSHPNVTQIYFIGDEGEVPFFAMEFLDGRSLETLLREEGKIAPERAVDFIRQAARGLKAAADRGIVHRDVKPSNLVLGADGSLKVTDFGLAKRAVAEAGLTLVGEVLGSPNYLAPEQASGAEADLRSDIYSLGATLYELLIGRPPFDGPTPVSIILKHVREPVRFPPAGGGADLPLPLLALTRRMLSKRPEDRPRDYDALIRELDRVLVAGAPSAAIRPRPAAAPRAAVAAGRSGSGWWILAPILALALVAAWGLLRRTASASHPEGVGPTPLSVQARAADLPGAAAPTRVLGSSSEVHPPAGAGARVFDVPPRLERLQEAARANLQFAENTHEITLDGRLRVRGSVINTGLAPATQVRVKIFLTDGNGAILASTEVALSPPFLPARHSGTFEATFPDPHQSVNIRTELNWNS